MPPTGCELRWVGEGDNTSGPDSADDGPLFSPGRSWSSGCTKTLDPTLDGVDVDPRPTGECSRLLSGPGPNRTETLELATKLDTGNKGVHDLPTYYPGVVLLLHTFNEPTYFDGNDNHK